MRNPEVGAFFAGLHAHPEVAHALEAALAPLDGVQLRSRDPQFGALYAVVDDTAFCAASGLAQVFFRLPPADLASALALGGEPCGVGTDWVRFRLFEPDRPPPDLELWARRAHGHARTGA